MKQNKNNTAWTLIVIISGPLYLCFDTPCDQSGNIFFSKIEPETIWLISDNRKTFNDHDVVQTFEKRFGRKTLDVKYWPKINLWKAKAGCSGVKHKCVCLGDDLVLKSKHDKDHKDSWG